MQLTQQHCLTALMSQQPAQVLCTAHKGQAVSTSTAAAAQALPGCSRTGVTKQDRGRGALNSNTPVLCCVPAAVTGVWCLSPQGNPYLEEMKQTAKYIAKRGKGILARWGAWWWWWCVCGGGGAYTGVDRGAVC